MTIHSWSGLGIRDSLSPRDIDTLSTKDLLVRRYNSTDTLIIDEVSMLSGNLLNLLDDLARAIRGLDVPFGGLQIVLVGDMFQLPPISRQSTEVDFAFGSQAWRDLDPQPCYLTEQHRQSGDALSEVLQAMRDGSFGQYHLDTLKSRMNVMHSNDVEPTRLYSHNVDVDAINAKRLAQIPGTVRAYQMEPKGPAPLVEPLKRGVLAPEHLELKVGAEVMFVANDQTQRYVNGTLGRVVELTATWPIVEITSTSRRITVEPHSWVYEEDGVTKAELRQIPLRLAWAITIHKSQGMSLDAAEIDLSRSFTPGMGYVALSRLRNIEGLYLRGLNSMALMMHESIFDFDVNLRRRSDQIGRDTEDFVPPSRTDTEMAAVHDTADLRQNLFEQLKAWRRSRAQSENLPAYVIAHDATLAEIAQRLPATTADLLNIRGMGTGKAVRYGEEILRIISSYQALE
jgi:ATP-dependent exoDNAse (exonuclease V) alpha subunit